MPVLFFILVGTAWRFFTKRQKRIKSRVTARARVRSALRACSPVVPARSSDSVTFSLSVRSCCRSSRSHALHVEPAGVGKLGQVAPDGLQRHPEMLREPLDGHLAVATGDLEDFRMAEGLGHVFSVSFAFSA